MESIGLFILLTWPMLAVAEPVATALVKDPSSYTLQQYGQYLGMALLGGLVSWLNKIRKGDVSAWNFMQLVGELTSSGFAGLLAFYFCEWMNFPPLLTIMLTGVFGHMGTRGIVLFERYAMRRVEFEASRRAGLDTVVMPEKKGS